MRRPPLLIGAVLVMASLVHAATIDCGVGGKAKIFDRLDSVGTAKINYRSTSLPCIQKGPAGSTGQISGRFDILYIDQPGSVQGAFVMPAPWYLNQDTRAKFLNTAAPSGPTEARKVGVKAEKLARFGSRGLGDTAAIDITNPPGPGGVLAILTVHNAVDGNTYRMCTKWATGSGSLIRHEVIDGGAGRRLFLEHGVVASCSIVPTTTSTSSTLMSTTSTSHTTTTSTSLTSTTSTSTSTTTSTTMLLSFVTGPAGGTCGAVKSGGSGGAIRKSLTCGGLNIGGGQSTVAEGPTPAGAQTVMNISGGGPVRTVTGRTSAQTGSIKNCSAAGCSFGPFLPIASAGTSTCVRNSFKSPGVTGTVNVTTGAFTGAFPLNSDVYLTGNATSPCPKCLAGVCDNAWTAGTGNPYPDKGKPCTAVNGSGDTYDCAPPPATFLGPIDVALSPITTGTASDSDAGGLFCPGQANSGAFGCSGSGAAVATCPGGNSPPLIDYFEEVGSPAGPLSGTPAAGTLASTFCIPSVGGQLGFLVNAAGNLPGPGATSLPGTLQLLP